MRATDQPRTGWAATSALATGRNTISQGKRRKWGELAVNTLVAVCKGEIKGATVRDRVTAANALLDRGYGKPVQSVDMLLIGKKIAELSDDACDHFTVML